MDSILSVLAAIVALDIGMMLRSCLPAYFGEKGKRPCDA
jgi:hypothetical protein